MSYGNEITTPDYVHSRLYRVGNKAVIVKPPMINHSPLVFIDPTYYTNPENEIRRHISAVEISAGNLPDLCPQQSFEIGEVEGVKVVVKELDWLDEVTPLSELTINEIISNREISIALEKTLAFALTQFVSYGRKFDFINDDYYSSVDSPIVRRLLGTLKNKNVFVGLNQNGERVVFIDSDWYTERTEVHNRVKGLIFPVGLFLANFLLLYSINKVRNVISNSEKGGGIEVNLK